MSLNLSEHKNLKIADTKGSKQWNIKNINPLKVIAITYTKVGSLREVLHKQKGFDWEKCSALDRWPSIGCTRSCLQDRVGNTQGSTLCIQAQGAWLIISSILNRFYKLKWFILPPVAILEGNCREQEWFPYWISNQSVLNVNCKKSFYWPLPPCFSIFVSSCTSNSSSTSLSR